MRIGRMILGLAIILTLGCSKKSTTTNEQPITRLVFEPASIEIALNQETTINLAIENLSQPVFALSLQISYDDSIVSFSDSSGSGIGDFFGQEIIQFVRAESSIIHLSISEIQGQDAVTGSGVIYNFRFTGEAVGNCSLRLLADELHFYDSEGDIVEIPHLEIGVTTISVHQ